VSVTTPLRVLLVGPSLRYLGGQAVQLQRLRRALAETPEVALGFQPVDPPLPRALAALDRVRFVRTLARSLVYAGQLFRTVPRSDVVHAFSASYWSFVVAPLPAMLVGRLFGKRVVLNYHSGEAEDHLVRWRGFLHLALRLPHRIVVPSEWLVTVFRRFGVAAESAPNFVELERLPYRRRAAPRPRFLVNRSHEPMYRVGDVLEAVAILQQEWPDAALIVVGQGSQTAALQRQAQTLRLRNVRFAGPAAPEVMGAYYDEADIFLNASSIDNVPLSILEAFAAGLPVVTSDAGGIPHVVTHERTGLLVPVGDPTALAAAARRLLCEPTLADRVASAARAEAIARYSAPAARERWLAYYRSVAA
jgi:glycosyltransferase involved in cell wall biosynthesis